MKYIEWQDEFKSYLSSLDNKERERILSYYAEMYADKRDSGLTEEEAIAEFGAPYDAAKKILDGEGENIKKNQEKNGEAEERGQFLSEGPVDALEINGALGNSFVMFYDGDCVKVDFPTTSLLGYKVSQQGGKVIITHKSLPRFGNLKNKIIPDMKIFIPEDLTPDCKIDLTAGKLKLNSGDYGKIEAHVEAGALEVGKINCSDASFLTDAGKINIEGAICHRLTAEINAGRLDAKDICGSTAEFRVNAGGANVEGVDCKRVEINVSAGKGDFTLCGAKEDYDIAVTKTLGSCNLEERSLNCERSVKAEVSLGSCSIKFEK